MIRSILVAILILASAFNVNAAQVNATNYRVKDSSGVVFTTYAIANGATVYSESIKINDNVGYTTILAKEDKSGGAGNVSISAEYSTDGTNFYTPYTTSAGTLTADSAIVSSLANSTRWIAFTARLAPYMRFKIVAAADSQVTLDVIYQRDR